MGLPKIGVHGLRHTAATLMLNHGVPIHIVANRLGHTDPSTTLSVYAHVMPDDDQIASTAIAQVLFNPIDQPDSRLPGSATATSVLSEGPPGQATDNAMGIRVATRSETALNRAGFSGDVSL